MKKMLSLLEEHIGNNACEFLLGGYGGFDNFALRCAKQYKLSHKNVSLIFVTPYMTQSYQKNRLSYLMSEFDSIIYPELENVPPKFAITYRNKYMVDTTDIIFTYIRRSYGGAYSAYSYAKKKNKTIIQI